MIKRQFYDIKFPFTDNNEMGHFIDLNEKIEDKVASQILHVILTRKRERIRMPDFGTNLIRYIYENNEEITWESIIDECRLSVEKYVPNAKIEDVVVYVDEKRDNSIFLSIVYNYKKGNKIETNKIFTKI